MAVVIQDNFNVAAAKSIDNRYGILSGIGQTVPYTNTSDALTNIPSAYRYLGLTVGIYDGSSVKEYWFKDNLTTLVPKGDVSFTDATNGLNLSNVDNKIRLGGDLNQPITTVNGFDIDGMPLSLNFNMSTFNNTSSGRYTQLLLDRFNGIMQSGDFPNTISSTSGSMSRLIVFKTTGSIWTNNYTSYAYEAQTRWKNANSWVTWTDAHAFQMYDNLVATNEVSALIAHYYDERVGNPNWQDTWTSTSSAGWPGWVAGKIYTLRTKKAGDNFPGSMGTTHPSSPVGPNTSGWRFTSNGSGPSVWSNGSIVDGDYPLTTVDQKYSSVSAQLGDSDYAGKGVVYVNGNGLIVNTVIDQRNSTTRGLLIGRFTNSTRPKSSIVPLRQGELFYNTTDNTLEFFISAGGGNDTWGVVTNTTTTYPS